MDTYKLGQLEMRKLSWWLREEREKAEKEKKDAQMAAIQARIEAGKAMAMKRKEQREALERSERMAKLRAAKRMKGKGRGAVWATGFLVAPSLLENIGSPYPNNPVAYISNPAADRSEAICLGIVSRESMK